MSGTLTTACPLCGLRYADRPLLELHIREDHLQWNRGAEPDHEESGDAGHPSPAPRGPSRPHGLASALLSTMNKVMATTTTRPGRSRSGSAMTTPHWAIRTVRYVNEELVRASEAISRSARTATRPRADVPAGKMAAQLPLRNALTGPPDSRQSAVQPGVVAGHRGTAKRPEVAEGSVPGTARACAGMT